MLNDFFNNKTTLQPLLNSKTWKKMSYCENKTKTMQTDRTNIENRETTQRFGSCEIKIKHWNIANRCQRVCSNFEKQQMLRIKLKTIPINYTHLMIVICEIKNCWLNLWLRVWWDKGMEFGIFLSIVPNIKKYT